MQAQSNHVFDAPSIDTNFPTTVSVAGKSNYGAPLYKTLSYNNWLQNISIPYAIASFDYSTTSIRSTPLFNDSINAFTGTTTSIIMPWFIWFITNYQAFECAFDLVLRPVKHSAHRGVIGVSTTLFGSSSTNISQGFLPIKHFDISGEDTAEYVYPIPNIYAFGAKAFYEKGRILYEPVPTSSTQPIYATQMAHLRIEAVTPLVASSMLPSTITFIVLLRPNLSTLKLHNPVLAASQRLASVNRPLTWTHD